MNRGHKYHNILSHLRIENARDALDGELLRALGERTTQGAIRRRHAARPDADLTHEGHAQQDGCHATAHDAEVWVQLMEEARIRPGPEGEDAAATRSVTAINESRKVASRCRERNRE